MPRDIKHKERNMLQSIFAKRLSLMMTEMGLNQVQLSQQSGIPQPDISRYVKKRDPKPENLLKLAVFFNVSPFYLYGMTDRKDMPSDIPNVAALQHLPPLVPPSKKLKISKLCEDAATIKAAAEQLMRMTSGLEKRMKQMDGD